MGLTGFSLARLTSRLSLSSLNSQLSTPLATSTYWFLKHNFCLDGCPKDHSLACFLCVLVFVLPTSRYGARATHSLASCGHSGLSEKRCDGRCFRYPEGTQSLRAGAPRWSLSIYPRHQDSLWLELSRRNWGKTVIYFKINPRNLDFTLNLQGQTYLINSFETELKNSGLQLLWDFNL